MFKTHLGEIFIIFESILWSLFPIFTVITLSNIAPLFSAALSTSFAAVFFGLLVTWQKNWHEIKKTSALKDILMGTMIIGVFMYSLIFIGLKLTSSSNASIVFLMEILFSFILLGLLKKEKINLKNSLGALIMTLGAIFILFPKNSGFNWGDLIILIAIAFAPWGNIYQQKARLQVSTGTMMFIRSLVSAVFLFILAFIFSKTPTWQEIYQSWFYIFINGFIFLGFTKIFWIEGIHLISITKAISLTTITPFFTMLFAYFILHELPNIWQFLGVIPIIIGSLLVLQKS